MIFSILPWNIRAWRTAFAQAGYLGWSLLCLMIAEFGQLPTGGKLQMHESPIALLLIRGPFSIAALYFLLAKPRLARVGMRDLRYWFALFTFLFLASVLWSDQPLITLGKAFEWTLGAVIMLEASEGPDANKRFRALGQIIMLITASVALLAVLGYFARIDSFVYKRAGLLTKTTASAPFVSGNGMGYMASAIFLTVFAQWQSKQIGWRNAWFQMFFSLFIFVFASSRTSFGIFLLGISMVLFRRSKALLAGFIVVLGSFVAVFRSSIVKIMLQNRSQKDLEGLSGRVIMWTAAIKEWKLHPILGVGGGVGGKVVLSKINVQSVEMLSSLHSGFMETLTGLGVVGIVLGTGLLIATTYYTLKEWKKHPENAGLYVMIIHIWITSVMSGGVLSWMSYEVAFYFILIGAIDVSRRQERFARARYRVPMPERRPSFAQ